MWLAIPPSYTANNKAKIQQEKSLDETFLFFYMSIRKFIKFLHHLRIKLYLFNRKDFFFFVNYQHSVEPAVSLDLMSYAFRDLQDTACVFLSRGRPAYILLYFHSVFK